MKLLIAILLFPLATFAAHFQVSFTGLPVSQNLADEALPREFYNETISKGDKDNYYIYGSNFNKFYRPYLSFGPFNRGSAGPAYVKLVWDNPDDTSKISIWQYANGENIKLWGNISIAETMHLDTIFTMANMVIDYNVITFAGDLYSSVSNDTDEDLEINSILVKAHSSHRFFLPFVLKMAKNDDLVFYETFPNYAKINPTLKDGEDYWENAYHFMTMKQILIRNKKQKEEQPYNGENLVYADIKSTSHLPMFGKENNLIYQGTIPNPSNITNLNLNTEWAFSYNDWGAPHAILNGEDVCPGHSTTHIIDYQVNVSEIRVSVMSKIGYIYFTMSLVPGDNADGGTYPGGACTMRAWDKNYATFDACPEKQRSEISAGTGIATFKVKFNGTKGTWEISAN